MPYRVTFVLGAFDGPRDSEARRILRHQSLYECLAALTRINLRIILASNGKIPLLYESGVRYVPEPEGQEDWQDVLVTYKLKNGDCFPRGTLLLRDDYELVPIENIEVGDRIWGRDAWTTVEAVVDKGELDVDGIVMNNGSVARLTPDHHMFVGRCPKHPRDRDDGYGCSCPLSDRVVEKIRVSELTEKDVLVTPERIAFGSGDTDPDVSYIEGLYVSDGWSEASRFAISGMDGHPKESQKREVEQTCRRLGLSTRWHRKYIAINDREWATRMHAMGAHAPSKRVLSLDLGEVQASATLRGVMADSKINANGGWTFTTTSRILATQTRVLHKMFGRSSSYMFIENHGGLGSNPIHRLGVRDPKQKSDKLLRVKRVERGLGRVPCMDIQTSDHYVYLPEHDVTVSNCEDLASWRAAELQARGVEAHPVFVWRKMPNGSHLYHIVVRWPDGRIEDPSRKLGMK